MRQASCAGAGRAPSAMGLGARGSLVAPTLGVALMVFGVPTVAHAVTFPVTNQLDYPRAAVSDPCACVSTGRGGACTLRAAVQTANLCAGPDVIELGNGSFRLTQIGSGAAGGDLDVTEALTVVGQGPASTTIDGSFADRVFDVVIPVSETFRVENTTIRNGVATAAGSVTPTGGCILHSTGSLSIEQVAFASCTADVGGAVNAVSLVSVEIVSSSIRSSTAQLGGGAYVDAPLLTVAGSTIEDNTAQQGGGLYVTDFSTGPSVFVIEGSTVRNNDASSVGGGLNANSSGSGPSSLTILDSRFERNDAARGGAVSIRPFAYTTQVHRTTFFDNHAMQRGGALDGRADVYESTFIANHSPLGGGWYVTHDGASSLTNSTFNRHLGSYQGGAIYVRGGATLDVLHATIAENAAGQGGGIFAAGTAQITSSVFESNGGGECVGTTSLGHNLSLDPACASHSTDILALAGLIGLANNGGPTHTMALSAGSAAIDSADPLQCEATDQRGVPRPQGNGCDIGAYEREP